MERAIQLAIVIVNFRTPAFVTECLDSLLPELADLAARVVVVDNNSGGQSIDMLRDWIAARNAGEQVVLVRSDRNTGFAGGNNLGIRKLDADFYLLLNSDTRVRPGAVRILLETASRFPDAGLISPRLEWPDGEGQESCFRFHTPVSELVAAAQTGIVDRLFKNHVVAMPVQSQIAQPQWTSFAVVLVRREVFAQAGYLDEGYFMYYEDAEFCHRAGKAGWSVIHDPRAKVVHLRGGSSPVKERARRKQRLPRYFHESRTRYFYQLYGWPGMVSANLMWWMGRIVSKARQLMGRSDKAAIRAQWRDIWSNWLDPLGPYTPPDP